MNSVLVISFSDIRSDARVRRQVRLLAERFEVTTCGFGDTPDGATRHVRIEPPAPSRARDLVAAALQRLRWYRMLTALDPTRRRARRALRGIQVDAVLADDLDTLPLAVGLWPDRVHADLHEYFPGIHDDIPAWVALRRPYLLWLLRRHVPSARSTTTVSAGAARRYAADLGVDAEVVPNAAPYHDLQPTPVGSPLRLVHSGVAQTGRRLETTMRAVARVPGTALDLYLMPSDVAYLAQLEALASELGPAIRVRAPLPQEQLIPTLNDYDVGVFVLPPVTTNNVVALPNKLFDYVQARLAILIGPTEEMAAVVDEHGLGVVAAGFDEDAIVAALESLEAASIPALKQAAHRAATELAGERSGQAWVTAIARIVDSSTRS